MRAVHKRYYREFFPAMAAYVVLVFVMVYLLRRVDALWLRAAIALLPVVPIGFAVRAIVRVIRGQDELEQRIELESIAVASAVTGSGFLTLGFLLAAKVLPPVDGDGVAIWVLPILFATYGLAKCFYVAPHYRSGGE